MKIKRLKRLQKLRNPRAWAAFLFWSWNLIFLAFILFGFAPNVLPELLTAMRGGAVPPHFPIYALTLTLIPVAAMLIGFFALRHDPARLFALAYGVEWPLMLLVAIRLFVFRETVPPVALLLGTVTVGMLVYLWLLFDQRIDQRGTGATAIRLTGLTLLMLVSLYAVTWFSFYLFPLAETIGDLFGRFWHGIVYFLTHLGEMLSNFWAWLVDLPGNIADFFGDLFSWEIDWFVIRMLPFAFFGILLGGYTATLLLGLPIALLTLYSRSWWRAFRAGVERFGRIQAIAATATIAGLFIISFLVASRQPQLRAFELLDEQPATIADASVLIRREDTIRNGLVNAFLAPRRYISARGQVYHIADMYESVLEDEPYYRNESDSYSVHRSRNQISGATRDRIESIADVYQWVASPVLYQPTKESVTQLVRGNLVMRDESAEAAALYQQYFDEPILEAERERIVRAAKSNWDVNTARRDWQAVDDREVHLNEQAITITEHGNWAEVELYEVYQNETSEPQEVLYFFSLPESAVVTGVWLGTSPDKSEAFTHRVAPRGAAQQVYKEQVRVNRDPALLEQLGPTQYKLRVFPIPAMEWRYDHEKDRSVLSDGAEQHLWVTYRVLASDDGWALPTLATHRNVYWDRNTLRSINGVEARANDEAWLPASLAAASASEQTAFWQRVDFDNGQSVLLRPATQADRAVLPDGLSLALVLDRSLSMQAHERDVAAALEQLGALGASVDVYQTASEVRGEAASVVDLSAIDGEEIVYFGGMNSAELLLQFDQLHGDQAYDAILVLTDDSGYELGESPEPVPNPSAPVWMIHLGGFPLGYDDDTLEAIQASGGGATTSLDAALNRIAIAQQHDRVGFDIVDDYVWMTVPTEAADEMSVSMESADELAPFAARRLILSDMLRQRDNLDTLESLDALHAIAVENSIVTPYSSMIVLVNDAQQRRLDALEARDNRFDREVEAVDTTAEFMTGGITGVPEPHEYVLMVLAVAMLFWYLRSAKQRNAQLV